MGKMLGWMMGAKGWMKGKKTYAVGLMMILQGAGAYMEKLLAIKGMSDVMELINAGANEPAMAMLMLGMLAMTGRAGLDNTAETK